MNHALTSEQRHGFTEYGVNARKHMNTSNLRATKPATAARAEVKAAPTGLVHLNPISQNFVAVRSFQRFDATCSP